MRRESEKPLFPAIVLLLSCLLSGCVSLSENEPLSAIAPPSFKGDGTAGDTVGARWWTVFGDSQLNRLMERIEGDNFQLRAGLARVDQACAVLGVTRSDLTPHLISSGSVLRNRNSDNDLGGQFFGTTFTRYRAATATSWEVDLWGRVQNAVCGAQADVARVEQLTDNLRLSLQSQLAQNYFSLRFLDEEKRVLKKALETRDKNLDLATRRFETGVNNELDVARAKNEQAATQADLARLDAPRTQLENAIAVLVGDAPACFTIAPSPMKCRLPAVKTGVPVSVLGNRPDVAAAIAKLESTSSRIGMAKAEFFPRIELIGSGGHTSISSATFFDWSSRTFTIGPEVTLPIFQGGRLKANLMRARAAQAEALADYQQTMLEALREVDDALAELAALQAERDAQDRSVSASNQAAELSRKRYEEGIVSSTEVIDSVRDQLAAKRRYVQICSQQYVATVRLIQAHGGGAKGCASKCLEKEPGG